jgi:uncharacterized protein (UPF0276 family)
MNKELLGVGINLRLDYIDELLEKKPKIDFLEIIADNWLSDGPHHKKLEEVRKDYEISFHCVGMNLCSEDKLNLDYLGKMKSLIEKYQPFQVSDHLSVQAVNGQYFHDLLPHPFNEELVSLTSNRISEVQEFLSRQILVENLSYYKQFEESDMGEVEFINELTSRADCHILLDLNNIWVNEKNFGLCSDSFLTQIDKSRVREIHIAGAEKFDGVYIDTHGAGVNDEVQTLLAKADKMLSNIPIIYERDNNLPEFDIFLEERKAIEQRLYV